MSNVIPIRDPWREVAKLLQRIDRSMDRMPNDGLTEGYLLSEPTRADLHQVIPLLREVAQLLQRADEREEPIYDAYCVLWHTQGMRQ